MPSVLFVVTAAEEWTLADGTKRPTGYWAEELIAPHRVFQGAGWDIHFATPVSYTHLTLPTKRIV